MQKLEMENEKLSCTVYINGLPDLKLIPKDKLDNIYRILEKTIVECVTAKIK